MWRTLTWSTFFYWAMTKYGAFSKTKLYFLDNFIFSCSYFLNVKKKKKRIKSVNINFTHSLGSIIAIKYFLKYASYLGLHLTFHSWGLSFLACLMFSVFLSFDAIGFQHTTALESVPTLLIFHFKKSRVCYGFLIFRK